MPSFFFLDDSEELLDVMKLFTSVMCNQDAVTCTSFECMKNKVSEIMETKAAFLDINLGQNQPSGVQAYQWLREHGYHSPVYFLSGNSHFSKEEQEALHYKNFHILQKPVSPERLQEIIYTSAGL